MTFEGVLEFHQGASTERCLILPVWRWADVELDSAAPKITVPAAISKNHNEDALPLHPDLVEALKQIKPASSKPEQLIFKGKFPGYKQFYPDLKAAGIDWEDHGDGRLDFHSFRVTYCTQLAPGDTQRACAHGADAAP